MTVTASADSATGTLQSATPYGWAMNMSEGTVPIRRGSQPLPASEVVLDRKWDKETRRILVEALLHPALGKVRVTRSGAILAGPRGMVTVHATPSDRRARVNLIQDLRRIGLR